MNTTRANQGQADNHPPPLPDVPLPDPNTLPPELCRAAWVAYRVEWRRQKDGWKLAKIPCDADGRNCGFDDDRAILPLADALHRAETLRRRGRHYGVGVTFARPTDLWILDLDGELAEPELTPRLRWLAENAPTWAEVSVSGTGLHLVYKGAWPENRKIDWRGRPAEIIGARKFVAITGQWWPNSLSTVEAA